MTSEERLVQAKKKAEQAKHRRILAENRDQLEKHAKDDRRKYIVGDLFCKHFPIAMEIAPGRSAEEDHLNFERLNHFMEALAKCLECYQEMEDSLVETQ